MLSDNKITAIFCLVDDLLKGTGHLEDPRRKFMDSKLITTTMVSTVEVNIKLADNIRLYIARKSNSKRPDQLRERFLKSHNSKRIETTFSEIRNLFLRKINAVTFKGFLIKIMMFVIAYTFNKIAE